MGTARVADGATRDRKRYDLERHLYKVGHRFPTGDRVRNGQPLSAWDCLCNLWNWLDSRDDPQGRMYGVTAEEVEREAWWDGKPGQLWQALVDTEWVEHDGLGYRWHDYWAMNGKTITDRLKKRRKRGDEPPNEPDTSPRGGTPKGTQRGTGEGTGGGTDRGRLSLGSGSGRSEEDLPPDPTSSVDPARERSAGGSLEPPAQAEGARAAPGLPHGPALLAALTAEPNLAQVPARADGRSRTLQTGRHYLGQLAIRHRPTWERVTASGARNPLPGRLLRDVDPEAFGRVVEDLERNLPGKTDPEPYVRSALADAWLDVLGRIADRAQASRARRGAAEDGHGEGREPPERGYAPTSKAVGISAPRPALRTRCAPARWSPSA